MSAEVTAKIIHANAPSDCPRRVITGTPEDLKLAQASILPNSEEKLAIFACTSCSRNKVGLIVPIDSSFSTPCLECKGCKLRGENDYVVSTGEKIMIGNTKLV